MEAKNINGYLVDAPDVFIDSRTLPLFNVPSMNIGNKPIDDGNYLFTYDEMINFIQDEPESKEYFYKWYGAKEFINNNPRYCLLVQIIPINKLTNMKKVMERIENVRNFRLKSKSPGTIKLANSPMLFHVTNIPSTEYLLIPRVSSERRRYIPIGYMDSTSIASDAALIVASSDIFMFAILSSNVHMAWMRAVAGRLKSDYRYSASIVYNNFPWPELNEEDKLKLDKTGNMILKSRAKYPDWSYANLYNPLIMPLELQKAHQINDLAVWQAYGKAWNISSEEDCVSYLMKRYQEITEK